MTEFVLQYHNKVYGKYCMLFNFYFTVVYVHLNFTTCLISTSVVDVVQNIALNFREKPKHNYFTEYISAQYIQNFWGHRLKLYCNVWMNSGYSMSANYIIILVCMQFTISVN